MGSLVIPASGISLHGAANSLPESEQVTKSAILFRLSKSLCKDLEKASHTKSGLQFVSGKVPRLRFDNSSIDLTLSPDTFTNELYRFSGGSARDLSFSALITHHAEIKDGSQKSEVELAGTDPALAALQKSLASYEQRKQANQAKIENAVLPAPNSRFAAAKQQKLHSNRLLGNTRTLPNSPNSAASTPRLGPAPISGPTSELAFKIQAMKTPLIHLLAVKPTSETSILTKTHIPKEDIHNVLQRIGKQVDGEWQLNDRSYKDLDVWNFNYKSQEERQAAIDNAVRAYDRLRLGNDEKVWQTLLKKENRDKGIVLSRLHLGTGAANRDLTPNAYVASPLPHQDVASDSRAASTVSTPRLGPAGTPSAGAIKTDVTKRLLSKDPKKARKAAESKQRLKKEHEGAASDREGKVKPTAEMTGNARKATTNPKVKSADIVHSSDEEDEGEIKPATKATAAESSVAAASSSGSERKLGMKKPPVASLKRKASNDGSSSSDTPLTNGAQKDAKKEPEIAASKSNASPAVKAAKPAGAARPRAQSNLSAPSSQQAQWSPRKSASKPLVPSPLGAARPRNVSDVSNISAVGVERYRPGYEAPEMNRSRKSQDTATSSDSFSSQNATKKTMSASSSGNQRSQEKVNKPVEAPAKDLTSPAVAGTPGDSDAKLKRKANDLSANMQAEAPPAKHRKTNSQSSLSQHSPAPGSFPIADSTTQTSPGEEDRTSAGTDDNQPEQELLELPYERAVDQAEAFLNHYYPAYTKLYDEQDAKEAKGQVVSKAEREKLWSMHKRLDRMKREIQLASDQHTAEQGQSG